MDKLERLNITKSTEELKKLIAEHPNYPIVVLAGEEANTGDYTWMYCTHISFAVGEFLDCEILDFDDETITDRDRLEEILEEQFYDEGLDNEELEKAVKEKAKELEPYWTDAIYIFATN